ncbi:MAG TPA: DNA repair protein RecN [Steroidobacteraceae bacterium]|nr:DNA repair protein RecN [Steroidobacteraceae bacterium]
MLTHLQIRDFAIIESIELEFQPGLTVLTGETGAGKSILVDALELISGARAGPEVIRHSATRAEISASFSVDGAPGELRQWLEEQSIAPAEELTIRRVVTGDGRSRAYLNGQTVPVQLLREIGNVLVDIHGQHEFQSLTRPAAQRELLDFYGRNEPLADQVGIAHRVWLSLLNRTLEIETAGRDREARLALMQHQVQELQALALAADEYARLTEERARLANRGRLAEGAQLALAHLYEAEEVSAHASASRALTALRTLGALDPKLAPIGALIDSSVIQMREAARELQGYLERLELDTVRQDQVERRLAAIEELARKHRVTPPQLPERLAQLGAELTSLASAATDLVTLRRDLARALAEYQELASRLSGQRAAGGRALGKDVTARIQMLGMPGGRFQVDVTPLASSEPAAHGIDQVEFRVSANPGQPLRPLAKVASGGELSRLSLAVQVASASRTTRCLVFDEVDAGIGGAIAEIVGRELRALGEHAQVLCVTHLPQVASQGHHHLRVAKVTEGRTTRTTVSELGADERVEELARMLGGIEVTAKARAHAREMLRTAAAAREELTSASSDARSSAARSARRE